MGKAYDRIARAPTRQIKNARVVCFRTPKTFYGVHPHLFLIHSLSTILITVFIIALVKSSIHLYLTFHLLFSFIKLLLNFRLLPVKHTLSSSKQFFCLYV